MTERINLVVDAGEKERFRQRAAREGKTLSEWLREAAREKLAAAESRHSMDTIDELRVFFRECDRREQGREPDWEEHLQVIEESVRGGGSAA